MNNATLNESAERIWAVLNTIENSKKTKQEQIDLIKPLLLKIGEDERYIGRSQVLNHFKGEIASLSNPAVSL